MTDHVVALKAGKIKNSIDKNGKKWISAIQKEAVGEAYLSKEGFVPDEQADKKHHGGVHKAVLICSRKSYAKLASMLGTTFEIDAFSPLGENIVVEHFDEENINIGDVLKIGGATVEVSQPREPCHKLSKSTGIETMTKTVYDTGLSGWYVRVLEEGFVKKGDSVKLLEKGEGSFSVMLLNRVLKDPKAYPEIIKQIFELKKLGPSFRESLLKRSQA